MKIDYNELLKFMVMFCIGFLVSLGSYMVGYYSSIDSFDFNINMDNNTKDAIQSLNESIGQLELPTHQVFNSSDCEFITQRQEVWCIV